jgi:hypothetical protein
VTLLKLSAAVLLIGGISATHVRAQTEPPLPTPTPESREALRLPMDAIHAALNEGGHPEWTLGMPIEDVRRFGKDAYVLRETLGMFQNIDVGVQASGRYTDRMLEAGPSLARIAEIGFSLTDVSAARLFSAPKMGWGVSWVDDADSAVMVIEKSLGTALLNEADRAGVEQLEPPIQRLLAQLVIAAVDSEKWILPAGERERLASAGGLPLDAGSMESWRSLLIAPWRDEANNGMATESSRSLRVLESFDRSYMAYGSMAALARIDAAVSEFRAWVQAGNAETLAKMQVAPMDIRTPRGVIRVRGVRDDVVDEPTWIGIDLGGNDTYTGSVGSTLTPGSVSVFVDVSGDDHFGTADGTHSVGCGTLGVGVLIDLGGNDEYACKTSGIGCALYGVGMVLDVGGDDRYSGGLWVQGAAHVGVGAVIDVVGNDVYECNEQSQAMGSTLGAGLLIDHAGNDRYVARDIGNISAMYLGQSVAMSQGCGYGRRADIGDGHSLAGGFGVLVDGAGDDSYHAQVWSQGCGYWWGVGILEDRGGNDQYRNGKYSAGAAAHYAVGVHVDLAGDDFYNAGPVRNETSVNQYQGHARDGSIGLFVDGAGNDTYLFRNHCAGSGDLTSIGVFFDRTGDDTYEYLPSAANNADGWNNTLPMGSTTRSGPLRSFRDLMPNFGVFVDGGGRDSYPAGGPWGQSRRWSAARSPRDLGIGIDVSRDGEKEAE